MERGKRMEVYINVKNFGKIKEARINISNFTVFVGNNNSGKTQLMQLIYAVVKVLSRVAPDITLPEIGDIEGFRIEKREIEELSMWVNQYLMSQKDRIVEDTFNVVIPIEEISVDFVEYADFKRDMYFLRGRTLEYLTEKGMITSEQLTRVVQREDQAVPMMILSSEITKTTEKSRMITWFSKEIPSEIIKRIGLGYILSDAMGFGNFTLPNMVFLPASRTGLLLLYKYYFVNRDKAVEQADDVSRNVQGMTEPVSDFLSFLMTYSYSGRVAKKNEKLIRFISDHLIDGRIKETGETTIYTPRSTEKEIPLFVASSMVNEIAPILKALTNSKETGFIFYDEVETSLHPLKQIEMAKLLNRLNNSGIRLIISTHSDTMATRLNNLMLLSHGGLDFEKVQRFLKKQGIIVEKDDLLVSNRMHVYQFVNVSDKESIVQELEFHKAPMTGYDFTLFNDSTEILFNEAKAVLGLEDED